jgi:RecJ-like exonuclease
MKYTTNSKNVVESIINLKGKDYFKATVQIMRKIQPGPVVLAVSDGYGTIDAVSKDCAFNVHDVVDLEGDVSERAGKLQIEIREIRASEKDFSSVIDAKSLPQEKPLSISSQRLELLKPYFLRIAHRIRKAIISNQPVLIRHHADADGIMSGLAIEKACELFMREIKVEPEYALFRSPSKAPFYETVDMLKDISLNKRLLETHGQKKPLIIVLDNGSTPEDVFAVKTLKTLGYDIIVVDHHNPVVLKDGKTAVCPYLLDHLNPYMYGLDGQLSAGMLSYEIARLIHMDFNEPLFPAVSAIGDRSALPEAEAYIKNAQIEKEKIKKMVIAIDFLAYQLRFDSGEGIYEDVFIKPDFVDILNQEVNKGVETQLQSTLPYLRTQEIEGVLFSHIDIEKYTLRFTYPTPGKVVGMIHDEVALGKEHMPVITIGYLSDMVIVRATKPVLPVAKIIKKLQKDMPEANADGGGHECAGTIKFVPAHLAAILENIKQQIRNLNYIEKEHKE